MEKDPRTHAIIGAAMEVHRHMGPGHLEAVYQECMEIELGGRNIPYQSKPQLSIYYKGRKLKKYYVPDFLCLDEVVVEIKAERALIRDDDFQISQIKISGIGEICGRKRSFQRNFELPLRRETTNCTNPPWLLSRHASLLRY